MGKNKNFKIILVVLLVGVTIFSVYKYVFSLKEKYSLLDEIALTKTKVVVLESEKSGLELALEKERQSRLELQQRNLTLKGYAKSAKRKISSLKMVSGQAVKLADDLNSELLIVKAENSALKEDEDNLKLKFKETLKENDTLKVKLSSVAELKKAIRELKRQARNVVVSMRRKLEDRATIEGNRGFLVRNGKPTTPAKIKIEVKPAPEKY